MVLDWIEADPGEMDAEKRLIINLNVTFGCYLIGVHEFCVQGLEGLIGDGIMIVLSCFFLHL